jgi:hypothetical protein
LNRIDFVVIGAAFVFWTGALTASLIAVLAGVYVASADWHDIS